MIIAGVIIIRAKIENKELIRKKAEQLGVGMIRFCNPTVEYVEVNSLDRKEMLEYFCMGHEDDVICVYENSSTKQYVGIVTYWSLQRFMNIDNAISKDYVILDDKIWSNARHYFSHYIFGFQEHVLLPVLNITGQLLCFAYEDAEANREIRMLCELTELPGAIQFSDIYSNYQCVKIYEFNELAYFFAKYLEHMHIAVEVIGDMWKGFYDGVKCQIKDSESLVIYAEGVGEKKQCWVDNLLRSVSVEFECIDNIYEANIKEGKIKDAKGDREELLERLKSEKEIIIYGTGYAEQDAYDYLIGNGIEVCCFVGMNHIECTHRMFGKRIVSGLEARNTYKNAVFIDCVSKNSAWGMGKIDYYDYIGYKRNESFILLKDYVEIEGNSLLNVLKTVNVVLTGDIYLCNYLAEYLMKQHVMVKGYIDILCQDGMQLPKVDINDIDDNTMNLLIVPEYFEPDAFRKQEDVELKGRVITYLKECGLDNYSEYFSYMNAFIHIGERIRDKYARKQLMPKKIVIGSIPSYSGKVFFRGLLDDHPSIMMIHYSNLNDELFWICTRLSVENAENIIPLFWEICNINGVKVLDDPVAFNEKMNYLLDGRDRYTSQELFIMIHIAYAYMYGRDISEDNIKDMIIYWEPHFVEREILENCVKWLGDEAMPCDIINVVRNSCMSKGSAFKRMILMDWCDDKKFASYYVLSCSSIHQKKFSRSNRLAIRFEDLKCNPQKSLMKICEEWDIEWSDTLMLTTCKGEKQAVNNKEREISGFDLEPVYNTYEKYFSEFDRFRIMLIDSPWLRTYGYPYVNISMFSRRELQDMFEKKFRFETMLKFNDSKEEFEYNLQLKKIIGTQLQFIRLLEYRNNNRI